MADMKSLIKKSMEQHTLYSDAFAFMIMRAGFADKYLAGLISMYKSYSWINSHFRVHCKQRQYDAANIICGGPPNPVKRRAWICWFQGIDAAPQIVKDCISSVKYWLSGWDIILITADNYKQYADLPYWIIEKWEKGIIGNAMFSDLLRLDLLVRNGGLWLDATTYLTGPLPDYITDQDMFVYRNGWMDMEMINMASWLIYSKQPNNRLLTQTRELLFSYWEQYDFAKNYFLLHMFFRMVTDANPEEWQKVPYFNQINNHLLMRELANHLDVKRVNQIKECTTVHKLTYKVFSYENNSVAASLANLYY